MKYIKGMKLDKETGELSNVKENVTPYFNTDLIAEDEKYDGYYSNVTSELNMHETEVIERYRGLWKIEETFKVTKTNLETRPIYVKKDEHIEAHFLSCFISLLILQILEMKIGNKYPAGKIIDSLKKSNVCLLDINQYKGVYYDKILEEIEIRLVILHVYEKQKNYSLCNSKVRAYIFAFYFVKLKILYANFHEKTSF